MDRLQAIMENGIRHMNPGDWPSIAAVTESMDLVAWLLTALFTAAVGMGIFLTLNTRRTFLRVDDVETTPQMLLARLQRDPSTLPPTVIVSRLGAEATQALLEYGDSADDQAWRYKWHSIRNELLYLMGQQNALPPIYALACYYRSVDRAEPDSLRIRRTVLIHKLGIQRHLEPNPDGLPSELHIRCHPSEVVGDLEFDGPTLWLMPGEPAPPPQGPLLEMEPIEFHSLEHAEVTLNIRRTPMSGGGFRIQLEKRYNMWIVVDEEVEWAS